jgi:hypothetical protein
MILIFVFCFAAFTQTKDKVPQCPIVSVVEPAQVIKPDEPVTFTSKLSEGFENPKIEYIWTIEGGKILEGLGTKRIKTLMDECGNLMTVTLEIKGLPEYCSKTASATLVISHNCEIMKSVLIDSYKKASIEEEKIKIDNLIANLTKRWKNGISAEGVIVLSRNEDSIKRLKWVNNYLTTKKIDKMLVSYALAQSSQRETQIWLVPRIDDLPDCDSCLIIRASNTEGLNKLFQKKSKTKKT